MLGLRPVLHSVVCICVCKPTHLHTTLCSAHLRCANTSEEKKTSILEVEKSYRIKTSGPNENSLDYQELENLRIKVGKSFLNVNDRIMSR